MRGNIYKSKITIKKPLIKIHPIHTLLRLLEDRLDAWKPLLSDTNAWICSNAWGLFTKTMLIVFVIQDIAKGEKVRSIENPTIIYS